jgi:hypothetical protein
MDALFMIYIIVVVAVFVRDEFKDEDSCGAELNNN